MHVEFVGYLFLKFIAEYNHLCLNLTCNINSLYLYLKLHI